MMNLRDKEIISYTTKQEAASGSATNKATSSSLAPRQWTSGFKNPRIVRVSRTFGGKDRHSKVCTVKGLRDRRIRLSVNTAIQLYDIQDRLGLTQPSKAIDWLLEVTKNDIDKLPPLPMIPGGIISTPHNNYNSQVYGAPQSSSYYNNNNSTNNTPFLDANLVPSFRKEGININNTQNLDVNEDDDPSLIMEAKLKYWEANNNFVRSKQKSVVDHHGGIEGSHSSSQIAAQNFFPIPRASNNNSNDNNIILSNNPMFNYFHWDPSSNLSLTQMGSHGMASHNDHQTNSTSLPSSSALIPSGSQLLLYPSIATTPSLFPNYPSYMNNTPPPPAPPPAPPPPHHQVENDYLRQISRLHFSNSLSSPSLHNNPSSGLDSKPFPFSIPHLHHHNDDSHNQDKGDHGS